VTKQTRLTSPETNPTTITISELRAAFNGRVIAPDAAGYDEARAVFYGAIDRWPAVIIRVASAADVSQVVSLARETGLNLAVRSGGHSLAGHSTTDGGIVLDLSDMKALQIDTERRTAWAETGLTAGEYTAVAGAHGLATGFGDTVSVRNGGITLGGVVGYLVRKHGLTIDDLLAAEVVTADGGLLHADAESHPELFWAIRGGRERRAAGHRGRPDRRGGHRPGARPARGGRPVLRQPRRRADPARAHAGDRRFRGHAPPVPGRGVKEVRG